MRFRVSNPLLHDSLITRFTGESIAECEGVCARVPRIHAHMHAHSLTHACTHLVRTEPPAGGACCGETQRDPQGALEPAVAGSGVRMTALVYASQSCEAHNFRASGRKRSSPMTTQHHEPTSAPHQLRRLCFWCKPETNQPRKRMFRGKPATQS